MTLRSLPHRIVDAVRARPHAPEVQFTPPTVRGGNILYYWQWAHLMTAQGRRASVQRTEHMDAWLQAFPSLSSLTVEPADVHPFDRRVFATRHHFGHSFTTDQNDTFCAWLVEGSKAFQSCVRRAQERLDAQTCVINVRRGDYYSNPRFRPFFSMDIPAHVSQALDLLGQLGHPLQDLLIVSDDPDWCRANLEKLLPEAPRYVEDRTSMFDDLATLASSRTLVLANSTFSYWGSHLARSLDARHLAIAPPYHERLTSGEVTDDLFDPRWLRTALSDGGADAP